MRYLVHPPSVRSVKSFVDSEMSAGTTLKLTKFLVFVALLRWFAHSNIRFPQVTPTKADKRYLNVWSQWYYSVRYLINCQIRKSLCLWRFNNPHRIVWRGFSQMFRAIYSTWGYVRQNIHFCVMWDYQGLYIWAKYSFAITLLLCYSPLEEITHQSNLMWDACSIAFVLYQESILMWLSRFYVVECLGKCTITREESDMYTYINPSIHHSIFAYIHVYEHISHVPMYVCIRSLALNVYLHILYESQITLLFCVR
jgi:hypothetical protein